MNFHKLTIICKASLLAALAVAMAGCTKNFVEYNTNPNETTKREVGALFLQMVQNVRPVQQTDFGSDRYQTVENMVGDGYAGYFGFSAPNINSAGRYNWSSSSWYGDMFNTSYQKGMGAWRDLRDAYKDDLGGPHFAMAQILKVAIMHRVTDTYGPIPYIDFGQKSVVKYDSQRDIYYKFFEELDDAVNSIEGYAVAGTELFSEWDPVYGGNLLQWVKFANTLRLRLALHISYVDPAKAKQEAEAAVSHIIGVMAQSTDLAQLQHISPIANYESPLNLISNSWNDAYMGATIDSYMNGYNDPRRAAYFLTGTGSVYRGIRAGMSGSLAKASYTTGQFSLANTNDKTNVIWMRASEAYFLRAEGALNDWSMGGTAKELYEAGIAMSFTEQNVSGAAAYAANTALVPAAYTDPVTTTYSQAARGTINIGWDGGTTAAIKELNRERIITQKYLAIFPVGQEAWTEFRRTGYPKVFPVAVNESNGGSVNTAVQIRRLPYPVTEYNTNRALLDAGITLLGGPDTGGTKLWWDTK